MSIDEKSSFNKSGTKYLRPIKGDIGGKIDVYAVLSTFDVTCPGRQHAIKKVLCAGLRAKGSELQDLTEARDAIDRAIQLCQPASDAVKVSDHSDSDHDFPVTEAYALTEAKTVDSEVPK